MKTLYFAPINLYGNKAYRQLLLNHEADYVFTELIMCDRLEKEIKQGKLEEISKKTIVQIGANTKEQIIEVLNQIISNEVNLNLGCPHSSYKKRMICSGILYDIKFLDKITKTFSDECKKYDKIPSVKIRIGIDPEKIEIEKYLKILEKNNIKKVYIHARTLRHPYTKPVEKKVLFGLKKKFPNLNLVYNGDIDSYEKYLEVEPYFEGVMIGRAALSNPLIFKQIKKKEKNQKINDYEPFVNNPNIKIIDGKMFHSREKKQLIREFETIAKKLKLSKKQIDANLKYLNKGITKTRS